MKNINVETNRKADLNNDLRDFTDILRNSGFTPEEFLFHSRPYVDGLKTILDRFEESIRSKCGFIGRHVLDLGCGSGLTSFLLSRRGFIVDAIDIYDTNEDIQDTFKKKGKDSQALLWKNLSATAPDRLRFGHYDGIEIPFDDNFFDHIFAHAVIEHIPVERLWKVIEGLYRILKSGGYLTISRAPNKFALTEFLVKSHDTFFSKHEIIELFADRFDLVKYRRTDFFPEHFPGKLQGLINSVSPLLGVLDLAISLSPLSIFSHHHFIILQKVTTRE
jgi:SAM-dependent methyltransferase